MSKVKYDEREIAESNAAAYRNFKTISSLGAALFSIPVALFSAGQLEMVTVNLSWGLIFGLVPLFFAGVALAVEQIRRIDIKKMIAVMVSAEIALSLGIFFLFYLASRVFDMFGGSSISIYLAAIAVPLALIAGFSITYMLAKLVGLEVEPLEKQRFKSFKDFYKIVERSLAAKVIIALSFLSCLWFCNTITVLVGFSSLAPDDGTGAGVLYGQSIFRIYSIAVTFSIYFFIAASFVPLFFSRPNLLSIYLRIFLSYIIISLLLIILGRMAVVYAAHRIDILYLNIDQYVIFLHPFIPLIGVFAGAGYTALRMLVAERKNNKYFS